MSRRVRRAGLTRLHEPIYDILEKAKPQGRDPISWHLVRGGGGVSTEGHTGILGADRRVLCIDCSSGYTTLRLSKLLQLYPKKWMVSTMCKLYFEGEKKQMSQHSMC